MYLITLADQLTLHQPVGADYAHHITTRPPRIFRTSYGPVLVLDGGSFVSQNEMVSKEVKD